MYSVFLVEGPVGAGKSTFAASLTREHKAVHLNLDDWMARLFRPDRPELDVMPWYMERKARCIAQIWSVAQAIGSTGNAVVLELGLIQQHARQDFFRRVDDAGCALQIYVLDADRAIRRARVRARNTDQGATFSMVVPDAVFEIASEMWEPVDTIEAKGRIVHWIDTAGAVPVPVRAPD